MYIDVLMHYCINLYNVCLFTQIQATIACISLTIACIPGSVTTRNYLKGVHWFGATDCPDITLTTWF